MKLTSIALLALTTFGIVNADESLNRSGGGSLSRRAESYPQLNRNGQSFNPLENLEKRASVCPSGDFACSDGNGCCPIGSTCVPNTTKCSLSCGSVFDILCSDGGCCLAGEYCGGDGYCYLNPPYSDIGTTTTTTVKVVAPPTTISTSLYAFPSTSIVLASSSSPVVTSVSSETSSTLPPPAISQPTGPAPASSSAIVVSNNNPVSGLSGATIKTVSAASIVLAAAVFVAQL